jgi:hypothetical protein
MGGGARQSKIVADTMVSGACDPRFFFDSRPVDPMRASSVETSLRILFDAMVAISCLIRSMIHSMGKIFFVSLSLVDRSVRTRRESRSEIFLKNGIEKAHYSSGSSASHAPFTRWSME